MNLVCYLSNTYPSQEKTLKNAEMMIEGGCDIIEIDIPTDNPHIDGPRLQKRMINSYNTDPSLKIHVDTIYHLREKFPHQKILILAYENTIEFLGIEKFVDIYMDNNIFSLILIDNKSQDLKEELMSKGVRIVSYIRSDLPIEDIENAQKSNSFIYLQAKDLSNPSNWEEKLQKNISILRETYQINREIYCGVGVSSADDIEKIKKAGAKGVFVGSSVFTKEKEPLKMKSFVQELSNKK